MTSHVTAKCIILLCIIGVVEAVLLLVVLFAIPGEAGTTFLFGYSRSRWMLAAWLGMGGMALVVGTLQLARNPAASLLNRVDLFFRNGKHFLWSASLVLLGAMSGVYFVWVTAGLTDTQVKGYFSRLVPLGIWTTLIFTQIFIALLWSYAGTWFSGVRAKLRGFGDWGKKWAPELCALVLLIFVILLLFGGVTRIVSRTGNSDYLAHVRAAERMETSKENETPYFLYQMMIIAAHEVFPTVDYLSLGDGVAVFFTMLTGIIIFWVLRWALRDILTEKPFWRAMFSAFLTLCLLLVTPVTLFSWGLHNLYYGYIGINVYHNPTITLLKPLALLLFGACTAMFNGAYSQAREEGRIPFVMIGLVSALGVLAKPSYVIALLPALGLIGVYWFLKKRRLDWVGLILGFFIPTVGLLAWQYLGAYSSERVIPDEAGIAFAPFIVYGRASGWLLPKFFLSFLFPLVVYSFYFSSARRDVGFNLAWLSFGVGALLTYFFAETGVRLQDANFAWSGQITLFVLYCVSTVFFIRQVVKREGCGKFYFAEWVCMGGFGLHLVSGLLWYVLHVVRPWDAWW